MSQDTPNSRRVGERLRQIREQQGLSLAECSERLHILASYLGAMEEGRYGALPGTVFLRGYVRSYARLLGLNDDQVVAQLDRELRADDEAEVNHSAAMAPASVSRRLQSRGFWLVVVVLLLLAGLAIWQFNLRQDRASDSDISFQENEQNTPSAFSNNTDIHATEEPPVVMHDEGGEEPSTSLESPENSMGGAPAATADDSADQGGSVAEAESDVPMPDGSVASERLNAGDVADLQLDTEVAESTSESPVSEESAVSETLDRLEVRFSGDCWFELTDADGRRRVGLFRAGNRLIHEGKAPFEIVIGAASVTQLEFNGNPVDLSQYSVRNNDRVGLTIGQ